MNNLQQDKNELENIFGIKLIFSIMEILVLGIIAIPSLMFTIFQNGAYKKGKREVFISYKRISTFLLWIGLFGSLIMIYTNNVFSVQVYSLVFERNEQDNNSRSQYANKSIIDFNKFATCIRDSCDENLTIPYDFSPYKDKQLVLSSGGEKIKLYDKEYTFPMKSADFFANTNIKIDKDIDSFEVSGHSGWLSKIDDGSSNYIFGKNPNLQTTSISECYVCGFEYYVMIDEDNPMRFEWNGITQDSDFDDVLNVLGAPGKDDYYNVSLTSETIFIIYKGQDGGNVEVTFDKHKKLKKFSMTVPTE